MSGIVLTPAGGWRDWLSVYKLYVSAFPASERKPFAAIRKRCRSGKTHVWCIRGDGEFLGLATTINGEDLILLDYFAVEKAHRSRGIGTKAMLALQEVYRDKGLFVEIESTLEPGPDREARIRRKRFYEGVGMQDLHTAANVFGVSMELMGIRCQLDFEGFRSFYREHNSPWAAKHLAPYPEKDIH